MYIDLHCCQSNSMCTFKTLWWWWLGGLLTPQLFFEKSIKVNKTHNHKNCSFRSHQVCEWIGANWKVQFQIWQWHNIIGKEVTSTISLRKWIASYLIDNYFERRKLFWTLANWHISVGELTIDIGESTSYVDELVVGELTRWRNDRYSFTGPD